jgi:hypothetical protein
VLLFTAVKCSSKEAVVLIQKVGIRKHVMCGLLQAWAKDVTAGRKTKGDKLGVVDHSKIDYEPFRRNFYIEVPDLSKMSAQEVAELRKSLDGIKVWTLPFCLAVFLLYVRVLLLPSINCCQVASLIALHIPIGAG